MCQLLITLGMITLLLYHKPTQLWVKSHTELFWIAFALTFVLLICMACCSNVRRKAPMNFIFLFLFTFAEAFLLSVAASTYESQEVSYPKRFYNFKYYIYAKNYVIIKL